MSTATPDAEQTLNLWLERDLSAEAMTAAALHEMDGEFEHAAGILSSGRNLLLVGESGVGKSALITELARRIPTLESLCALRGARVIELSVGLRMSRLRKDESIFEAFSALMDAVPHLQTPVISYFRDGDMLHQSGIAARLDSFCMRQRLPVIVEGRPTAMNEMLEFHESIEHHFVTLTLNEPDVNRALRIVTGWANDPLSGLHNAFDESALSEAVYLTHRFLARSRLPRKAMDLLRDTAATCADMTTDSSEVIARFCQAHHTPRWLVDPSQTLALDALDERMRDALLGQNDAVDAALSTIALVKSGLCDLRRPFGIYLFVGPTGVGKTHLAQMLAVELFGSAQRMVRINMGDFADSKAAQAMFGDPEHHLALNRRGVLTQRLMGQPFGVVLLDEFEKAHPSVHDRLLSLIDEGCFINGAGESISCRSCIIIATSNAGAEVYRESARGFTTPSDLDSKRDELDRRLREIFRFELLNRFDRVVHFHPLARDAIRELAARELRELEQRPGLRRHGTRLQVDEAVLDWLAAQGYNAQYGARFLKRTIERTVTTAIADLIARRTPEQVKRIGLDVHRGQIRARTPDTHAPPTSAHYAQRQRPGHAPATGLDATALIERALPRLTSLERDIGERDQLLNEMSQMDFWNESERRNAVTERFRTLDVSIRLTALIGDLRAAWAGLRLDSPEIVRTYGEPGGLVVDPRSGATTPLRAVHNGRLEAFHEAFSRGTRPPEAEA